MSINIKARQTKVTVGDIKDSEGYAYQLQAETYNTLTEEKVAAQAALNSGLSKGAILTAWKALSAVIGDWVTEGHSIPIWGLGTMRFSVRAHSVADVKDVSTSLIYRRKVIFNPSTDLKAIFAETPINITCYDKDGNIVKRTQSADSGEVEDGEDDTTTDSDTTGDTTADGNV